MNSLIKTHVEGHAAAQMAQSQANEAILFINKVPCTKGPACATQLPRMLAPNARLHVFGPDLYYQVFVGLP